MSVDSATLNQNEPNKSAKHLRSKVKLNAVFMAAVFMAAVLLDPERLRAKRGLQQLTLFMAEKPVRSDLIPVTS